MKSACKRRLLLPNVTQGRYYSRPWFSGFHFTPRSCNMMSLPPIRPFSHPICRLWQYGLWSFQRGYTKLERFLHKNQHAQRILLNFENWTNKEPQLLAKIRGFKVDYFDFSCKKLEKLVFIRC